MADKRTPPIANDPPEQAKPEQVEQRQQEQQPQAIIAAARQDRRPAPGRRPLFRT